MSLTRRDFRCTPSAVFDVLGDGWLFGLWVVGASRIRDVDAGFPAPGAQVHHSVGSWPLLLNDTTTVIAWVPNRHVELRAKAWPAGEAQVRLDIAVAAGGCTVTMTEDATAGPAKLLPSPIRNALLHWRNIEALRRLSYLAENRSSSRESLTGPSYQQEELG